ncbi:putative histone deacetylase [Trypanosoma theileri]|uniref:Putative histone deacetylase n=1 Tax=Trypanosoma theileri TaxID=67003 RepID=A0A1X0NRJ0_9TRYP|nr:putative histone deacetylase [Trypanosoma theileri]ORC87314.1 putative histone deacetylase [Trypanosoma theileri]
MVDSAVNAKQLPLPMEPSSLLLRSPPVVIIVGQDVDASAMPLTYERNRLLTDLLRHYSCPPFLCKTNMENKKPFSSEVFEWFSDLLPVVGTEDMTKFHEENYVRYLSLRETMSDVDEEATALKRFRADEIQPPVSRRYSQQSRPPPRQMPDLVPIAQDEEFNLIGDNAPFLGMWRTIQATLSGTLTAVRLLAQEERFAAIHWFGGRHHAKQGKAGGFCFINDVVLAILEIQSLLPSSKKRIIVVDIDAHHGDGTQAAFLFDDSVLTLSIHAYGIGIYPGTGSLDEIGGGIGRGFTMNLPLPEGSTDSLAVPLACRAILSAFQRVGDELGAVIIVCGSDALCGDPLGSLNLSIGGMQFIIRELLIAVARRSLKVLILGAGGYVDVSCARLAAVVTRDVLSCASALQRGDTNYFRDSPDLSTNFGVHVPEDSEYFTRYGPSFLMHGLPPARLLKVRQIPPDSELFARMRRIAEKKSVKASSENPRESSSSSSSSSHSTHTDEEEEEDDEVVEVEEYEREEEEEIEEAEEKEENADVNSNDNIKEKEENGKVKKNASNVERKEKEEGGGDIEGFSQTYSSDLVIQIL